MAGSQTEQRTHAPVVTVSSVTTALVTAGVLMFLSGVATALFSVPSVVQAVYYVSSVFVVALLWVHSLQTVRQQ